MVRLRELLPLEAAHELLLLLIGGLQLHRKVVRARRLLLILLSQRAKVGRVEPLGLLLRAEHKARVGGVLGDDSAGQVAP